MLKRLLTTTMLVLAITLAANAQQKIKKSELENKRWKLVIDIQDEIEEEIDESDGFFERLVLKSVSGFVDNILDEIEIYFEFREDNELKVVTYAFGEREVEYTRWFLDRDGALVIDSTDKFDTDEDRWYKVDDIIIAGKQYERGEAKVYLVSVEE